MSKIDAVRAAMVEAMKAKDKARKDSLSMLLSALKNAEINKREPLTEEEENAVVKKEIKQTQETYEMAPADREDIRSEAAARMAVYKEFAPEDMSAEQIREVISAVLSELGIENPTAKDKGAIMKVLMPRERQTAGWSMRRWLPCSVKDAPGLLQVPVPRLGALSSRPDRAEGRTEQHNKRMRGLSFAGKGDGYDV